MTSSVTPDIKIEKIAKIAKISKIAKAAKKVVKHISSEKSPFSESSVLSKSLSDSKSEKSIIDKVLMFVKHPKFKWVVLGVILITLALGYFKYQQKLKAAKNKLEKTETKNSDKDVLRQQLLKQQFEMAQIQAAQQAAQMQAQMQAAQQVSHQSSHQASHQSQASQVSKESMVNTKKSKKHRPPTPSDSSESSNSSEEVFIEDQNVMRHNLTQEEMNEIDRHLENVNIDNLHE
jgi:hypothetical protein